ncbi:putative ribonuclease H-like domain-containing protein [Tanacetum coccineum]
MDEKNKSKTDKNRHGMEKLLKDKAKSEPKTEKSKGLWKTLKGARILALEQANLSICNLNRSKNKRDERSIVVKNKAKLVAQGFRQEEGIDYDKVFAPVARIEAIRLFLAFASYMGFTVYQMDVKSAFLYDTIEEEVYVHQPPGFVDPAHPNKVYKVIKSIYGLHQAPRAWYETLSSFLMENGFRREFEDCMHKRFQMSSMGELTFFLGLQVKQQPDGIFISQDKYVAKILKKFDFWSIRTATTPIESNKPLVKDEDGEDVDVHVYRSLIGSLMYLIESRPDIMFAICAYARFQVTPKASHSEFYLNLRATRYQKIQKMSQLRRSISRNRKMKGS